MDEFQQWRDADRVATEAEAALARAFLLSLEPGAKGAGPSQDAIAHARHLRAVAHALFDAAMKDSSALTDPNVSRLSPL